MKVHVAGPSARQNFGNDLTADVVRSQIRSFWPEAEISIAGVDDGEFSPTRQDASVLVGSGLFDDRTYDSESESLGHFLRYPAAMQWFDKKSYLLGVGVQGHLERGMVEPHLPTLDGMQLRTVRDSETAEILRESGVSSLVLECADLSYLAPRVRASNSRTKESGRKPILGVVVSQAEKGAAYSGSDGFEGRVSEAVASIENQFDIRFISFDQRSGNWLSTSHVRFSDSSVSARNAGNGLGQAIGDVDVLLTSHVHSIVLAASMGMPFVAIGANGEDSQRECRALDYPFFLTLDANANDIVRAIQNVSDERSELNFRLTAAAPGRVALARRTVEALRALELEPASAALEVFRAQRKSSGDQKLLLVWAAPGKFLAESEAVLSTIGIFDAVTPPNSDFEHPGMNEQFVLEQPGIMSWNAFREELRQRLRGAYDGVVVCHPGSGTRLARNLANIATKAVDGSGRFGCLEYRLWTQAAHTIPFEELEQNAPLASAAVT